MSESAPTPSPQPRQPLPGDQVRRHPIFGDDLDDQNIYGAGVPENEWLTGAQIEQPEEPVYTVDSIVAEHEAAQRAEQSRHEPGLVRRALGRVARIGSGIGERIPTEADARHARHHVHELLEHAAFNRRGIPDNPKSKNVRNLASNPELAALQETVEWVLTRRDLKPVAEGNPRASELQYMPSNDRNAMDIRHGVEHVVHARRSIASPEEQQQLADPRWSRLLDPANVRALRERIMALTASPQAMGQGNEATRAYKRHETDLHLAQTGIRGIRPAQLLADYLGIKPEMLWKTGGGGAPEAVLNELNFLVKLDSRPLDSRGTTALDYLLPFNNHERNAQLAAADRFVDTQLQRVERQFDDGMYPGTVVEAPAELMRRRMQGTGERQASGFHRFRRESIAAATGGEVEEETGLYVPGEEDTQSRGLNAQLWRLSQMRQAYMALSTQERSGAKGQDMKSKIDALDAKVQKLRS